jgi:hypothetical protein
MNIPVLIASAVGFIAAELLIAIVIAKWLERGTSMFEAPEPDAYLRKAYLRASDER